MVNHYHRTDDHFKQTNYLAGWFKRNQLDISLLVPIQFILDRVDEKGIAGNIARMVSPPGLTPTLEFVELYVRVEYEVPSGKKPGLGGWQGHVTRAITKSLDGLDFITKYEVKGTDAN